MMIGVSIAALIRQKIPCADQLRLDSGIYNVASVTSPIMALALAR